MVEGSLLRRLTELPRPLTATPLPPPPRVVVAAVCGGIVSPEAAMGRRWWFRAEWLTGSSSEVGVGD